MQTCWNIILKTTAAFPPEDMCFFGCTQGWEVSKHALPSRVEEMSSWNLKPSEWPVSNRRNKNYGVEGWMTYLLPNQLSYHFVSYCYQTNSGQINSDHHHHHHHPHHPPPPHHHHHHRRHHHPHFSSTMLIWGWTISCFVPKWELLPRPSSAVQIRGRKIRSILAWSAKLRVLQLQKVKMWRRLYLVLDSVRKHWEQPHFHLNEEKEVCQTKVWITRQTHWTNGNR